MVDSQMNEAVWEVIRASFLRPSKEKDVAYLAASRIAIDLLTEAWKDLSRYSPEKLSPVPKQENVGL